MGLIANCSTTARREWEATDFYDAKQRMYSLPEEEKFVPTPSSIAILANTALAKSEGSIITGRL